MGVHMPPSPMPYQASRRGGRSRHGRKLRIGIAAPAAVVQPQRRQRHAEAQACPSEWRCRAQAPRCRCARAARHRRPPSGGQDPPPGSRLERHAANPSIAVPGRADRSRSSSSTIRSRQPWSPPCFSITASSMPRIACSIRAISRRAGSTAPEAAGASAQFPRIVPARSISFRVRTTATISTDRPCLWSACQVRAAPRAPPAVDREVAACASGGSPVDPEPAGVRARCRAPRTRRPSRARSGATAGPCARSRSRARGGGASAPRSRRSCGGECPRRRARGRSAVRRSGRPSGPQPSPRRPALARHGPDEPARRAAVDPKVGRELGAGEHAAVQADERDPLGLASRPAERLERRLAPPEMGNHRASPVTRARSAWR